jgi:presequence protease
MKNSDTHGLQLNESIARQDLKANLDVYSHPSNARVIRIKNDDPEKLFCAVFRTKVNDSTGVPHILEHSVLSGSKKYPLSDPFVTLLKTSMPTFLNAMTYPDKTMYPVGSANFKDFMNLSDVYLDTCFSPLLTQETFEREGWRYELNDKGDLEFQGIVYNEMKGVYSDVERYVIDDGLLSEIYPDNEYSHISGGNPENITDLTYEQFISFYKTKYHPANSIILVYGSMTDSEEKQCLDNINSYLNRFEPSTLLPIVNKAADYTERKIINKTYQSTEDTNKVYSNIIYRLNNTLEATVISLLLEYFLNDTRDCYLEIMKTGLVERFVSIGVENDLVQPYLGISLELKEAKTSSTIQSIFEKHINKAINEGLDKEYLKALINKMEYAYIETLDHNGFGIINEFARRFGKDEDFLHIDYYSILDDVKKIVTDPTLIQELLNKLIIKNVNSIIVEFLPDPEFNIKKSQKEKAKLVAIKNQLTPEQIKKIKTKSDIIKLGKTEDESVVPRLTLKDLKSQLDLKPVAVYKNPKYSILTVKGLDKQTSNLTITFKVDKIFDLENLGYLELFFSKFFTFATPKYSEQELEVELKQNLGSYSSSISLRMDGLITGNISFGYLDAKQDKVFGLIQELFSQRNCNSPEILKNMIDSSLSHLEYTIQNESDEIISERLNMAIYDTNYYKYNSLKAQEIFLKSVQQEMSKNMSSFVQNLEMVSQTFKQNMEMSISTLGIDQSENVIELANYLSSQFHTSIYNPIQVEYNFKDFPKEILEYQSKDIVNYHRQAIRTDGLGINDGLMYLMSRIMTYEYGWTEVRSKGGAYGVRLGYNEPSGLVTALTYRDPRSTENFDLITNSLQYIVNMKLDAQQLESYKIATINSYSPYRNTENEFYYLIRNYYGQRNTNDHINQIYMEIINTTIEELKAAATKILSNYNPVRAVSYKIKD